MRLLDVANQALEGFDVEKDNPNAGERIPVGDYDVVLNRVNVPVFNSGYTCLQFECEVTTGEFSGRKENVRLNLDPNNPHEFILNRSVKQVAKLAFVTNTTLVDEDWYDENTLSVAFHAAIGSQFILNISETPNKKEPSKPYRNYNFEKYAEENEPIELPGEDEPF